MSAVRTAPNRPGKSHDLSDSTLWLAAFSLWFVFAPLDFAGKKLRNGAVVWSDELLYPYECTARGTMWRSTSLL